MDLNSWIKASTTKSTKINPARNIMISQYTVFDILSYTIRVNIKFYDVWDSRARNQSSGVYMSSTGFGYDRVGV